MIKASGEHTDGRMTVVEFHDVEGSAPPLHARRHWDSGYYVVDGDYVFVVGDERRAATAGAWTFVPRGVPHAWRCRSTQGRIVNVTVPSGIESFYREVGLPVPAGEPVPPPREPDFHELARIAERHGITIVGPPPR